MNQVKAFGSGFAGISSAALAALSLTQMTNLGGNAIASLDEKFGQLQYEPLLNVMTASQWGHVTVVELASLSPERVGYWLDKLPAGGEGKNVLQLLDATALSSLTKAQWAALTPQQVAQVSSEQFSNISLIALAEMGASRLSQFSDEALSEMRPEQFLALLVTDQLTDRIVRNVSPWILLNMPADALSGISSKALQQLSPAIIGGLWNRLTAGQRAGLNTAASRAPTISATTIFSPNSLNLQSKSVKDLAGAMADASQGTSEADKFAEWLEMVHKTAYKSVTFIRTFNAYYKDTLLGLVNGANLSDAEKAKWNKQIDSHFTENHKDLTAVRFGLQIANVIWAVVDAVKVKNWSEEWPKIVSSLLGAAQYLLNGIITLGNKGGLFRGVIATASFSNPGVTGALYRSMEKRLVSQQSYVAQRAAVLQPETPVENARRLGGNVPYVMSDIASLVADAYDLKTAISADNKLKIARSSISIASNVAYLGGDMAGFWRTGARVSNAFNIVGSFLGVAVGVLGLAVDIVAGNVKKIIASAIAVGASIATTMIALFAPSLRTDRLLAGCY